MKLKILKLIGILLIVVLSLSSCYFNAHTETFNYFLNEFSPFFCRSLNDLRVVDMTQIKLVQIDNDEVILDAMSRKTGLSDVSTSYDVDSRITTTVITLNPEAKFSDGTPLTADDVIFSYHVYADLFYIGWSEVKNSTIIGIKNYTYNNSLASETSVSDEEIENELKNPTELTISRLKEQIIIPFLKDELEWVRNLYRDDTYKKLTEIQEQLEQYPETKDLFAFYFSIDDSYDSTAVESEQQVLEDIINQYGYDYQKLEEQSGTVLSNVAEQIAKEVVLENKLAALGGQAVDRIEGIKKLSQNQIEIKSLGDTTKKLNTICDIYVAPLHYYGDISQYDYENNKFGFTRGQLDSIKEKNSEPLGAGQYVIDKYKDYKIYFKRNKSYVGSAPLYDKVVFKADGKTVFNFDI